MRAIHEPELQQFRKAIGTTFGVGNNRPVHKMSEVKKDPKKAIVRVGNTHRIKITTCVLENVDADGIDMEPLEAVSSSLMESEDQADQIKLARIERQKVAICCPFAGTDMEHTESSRGLTDLHFVFKYKNLKGDAAAVLAFTEKDTKKKNTKKRKRATNADSQVDELEIPNVVTNDSEDESTTYDYGSLVGQTIRYNNYVYEIDAVSENGGNVEITRHTDNATDNDRTTITTEEATHILQRAVGRTQ